MGRKLGGAGSEAYVRTKWHFDPSSHLATTDMDRFFRGRGLYPLGGVELDPHLTQCYPGQGLLPYQVAS